ncbi:MAG TPA: GH1 family beta-glucosidase [Chloroflexota bacterium]|jgi:beta-glucosidase
MPSVRPGPAQRLASPEAAGASDRLPEGFVWGAATAAYQIEGAAREDGRGESIWDRFSHTPGKTANGDTGDVACDHYHRWAQDVQLMRDLGLRAYRFSVAWPRVLPAGRGAINEAGLAFYERLVDALLAAGITPWITLYHWDLPQPLEDAGGWPNRSTAAAFTAYADGVTRRLGDRVRHWITLNEPWCSAVLGYYTGDHAPGRTDQCAALAATHTLLLAHGEAVAVIRANSPGARVGITLNLTPTYAADPSPGASDAARRYDGHFNRWFLDPLYVRGYPEDMLAVYGDAAPRAGASDFATIAAPTDFLGVNYYTSAFIRDAPASPPLRVAHARLPDGEYTAMDWLVYPRGLADLLDRLARDYPVGRLYITENGAAYADPPPVGGRVADAHRTRYLHQHLAVAAEAARRVPLNGYFLWSLMDNFEWGHGYTKRFGITYVDYATQRRIVKDSGHWYRQVIAQNRVVPTSLPR